MSDYPDYTNLTRITGTEITLPIDIVAQTVATLAVDIQAQTLSELKVDIAAQTLETVAVDIKAQTLTELKVDIAAQTLETLKVDIAAQTLAELNINIAAQTVDVNINFVGQTTGVNPITIYSSETGNDIDLLGSQDNPANGTTYTLIDYTVPTGKTLYVTDIAVTMCPVTSQAELGGYVYGSLYSTAKGNVFFMRQLGGFFVTFTKPKRFEAGDTVRIYAQQDSGVDMSGGGTIAAHLGGWLE